MTRGHTKQLYKTAEVNIPSEVNNPYEPPQQLKKKSTMLDLSKQLSLKGRSSGKYRNAFEIQVRNSHDI
jgi:hypothetical protein